MINLLEQYIQQALQLESYTQYDAFNTAFKGTLVLETPGPKSFPGSTGKMLGLAPLENLFNVVEANSTDPVNTVHLADQSQTHVALKLASDEISLPDDNAYFGAHGAAELAVHLAQQITAGEMAILTKVALGALVAILRGSDANYNAVPTSDKVINMNNLVNAQALLGAKHTAIKAWATSSPIAHNYLKTAVLNGTGLYNGSATNQISGATYFNDIMGRPVLFSDAAELSGYGSPLAYDVIGLIPGAVRMKVTNRESVVNKKSGTNQISTVYQQTARVEMYVSNYSYTGSNTPQLGDLALNANWAAVNSDVRSSPGVILTVNG